MAYGKTTLHGVSQSVPSDSNLPDRGNQGSQCMTEDLFDKRIYDLENGLWLPSEYLVARYDFDVDGGAMGSITLSTVVPANTIILDGFLMVLEALIGSGGISVTIEASADLLDTTVPTITVEGQYDLVPDGTAANAIKTTVARSPVVQLSGNPITAGVFLIFMRTLRGFPAE